MLIENIRIAFGGLVSNKLRTILSVLGILIGVMSVTLLLAVGTGASRLIDKQVSDLGAGVLYVFPKTVSSQTREPAITKADVDAIKNSPLAPSVVRISPELIVNDVTATIGAKNVKPRQIVGMRPEWFTVYNRTVATGLKITESDVAQRRRITVIGVTIQKKLFGTQSAVGKTVRIGAYDFDVVGILQKRGGGLDGDQDAIMLIPETTMSSTLRGAFKSYDNLTVQGRKGLAAGVLQSEIGAVLSKQHRITNPTKYDWDVFDNAQLGQVTKTISVAFRGLLGLIAGISLLVGGIGVMNIMLVTVTERTREIGIRKALGAHRSHLLSQFLVEAIVLTGVGGLLGVAAGVGLSQIKVGPASAVFQPWMGGLAFGVSVLIGIVFGVYPANRAAKLRPIDALRFE